MKISLVSTILNDQTGAKHLFDDLVAQTRHPDECVIIDGGSKDGTFEYLQQRAKDLPFKLKVYQEIGANVSRGRNLAIERSSFEVILTTDFGCRLDSHWVEELIMPFIVDPKTEIVTGSWLIRSEDVRTPAQWAEWALADGKIGLVATPNCLASTRSIAFLKHVWLEFGRYPEDLTLAGDDAIFSLWMVLAKKHIAAAPNAICYWHRFGNLHSYWREARRNFRGAGEAIFFLKHGVLTGIMFLSEIISLAFAILALLSLAFGVSPWVALTGMLILILIWSRRLGRWLKGIYFLKSVSHSNYWPWLIALDVGTRYNATLGYWHGFFYGFNHCQACRRQLKSKNIRRW